jgi:hypothetical protein
MTRAIPTMLVAAILAVSGAARADKPAVASAIDTSAAKLPQAERDIDAAVLRRVLATWAAANDASGRIDVSIASLTTQTIGRDVCIDARVQLAVSDDHGRLHTVMAGAARVEVAVHQFRPNQLPSLRQDAMVAATRGVLGKLRTAAHAVASAE